MLWGERLNCAVEQHAQTLKKTCEHTGDSLGARKEALQLSFSKAFTWRAGKHLLGAPDGRGFYPHERWALTAQLLAFWSTVLQK